MTHPATRVLTVLELLQTRGRMTGAEIAQQLDVDRRTVRRYIARLEEMGVPITAEQGRDGGYMLVAGFKLPPMMVPDDRALALSRGLLVRRRHVPSATWIAFVPARPRALGATARYDLRAAGGLRCARAPHVFARHPAARPCRGCRAGNRSGDRAATSVSIDWRAGVDGRRRAAARAGRRPRLVRTRARAAAVRIPDQPAQRTARCGRVARPAAHRVGRLTVRARGAPRLESLVHCRPPAPQCATVGCHGQACDS